MAKLTILATHDFQAIADLAGLSPFPFPPPPPPAGRPQFFSGRLELNLPGISQTAADAALADYVANQVARDAAWAAKIEDENRDRATRSDHRPPQIFPLLEVMREELNVLRALHSLPDLQRGQMIALLNNKIRNP